MLVALLCAGLLSCSNTAQSPKPQGGDHPAPQASGRSPLILSILPVERVGAMYERFVPLKYYLEKTLGVPVIIKVAKDYESAIEELGSGRVQMACLDPATYCQVRARYKGKVVPLVKAIGKEGATSRSVLVAKSGSGIERVVDVKGKRIALGNEQSSFSYLIPLSMLSDLGVERKHLSDLDLLQQEDRVALSVLIGRHDVGGISEAVARKYGEDGLKIIKRSEAIPQYTFCVSAQVPVDLRDKIGESLRALKDAATLSSIDRDIEALVPAEDRDFDVIRVMIKNLFGKDYMEYGPKTIRVAVLPLYSPITIYDRYDPLMRHLSKKTGYEFKLVIPRDFEDFIGLVRQGRVDFSYQNPYVFALIDKEVKLHALAKTVSAGDEESAAADNFRGVIITRHDGKIRHAADLLNKRVLVVSRKSAGGYLSQVLFLKQIGMDPESDMRITEAKRQENVILGVYRGEADAGFVRESALAVLKDEIDLGKIRVIARTRTLPNWPFALCRKLNPSFVNTVKGLLLDLRDPEILRAARIDGFKPAEDAEFEELKRYAP